MSQNKRPPKETFVSVGTEQPTDVTTVRARDRNNYLPVSQQEVRDEKGRKRLHGAFTGGFSAGYFNTVGSKEGWNPTEFISKRDSRAEHKEMKPQDFMDEEDVDEFLGAKKVGVKEDYDVIGSTEIELKRRRLQNQQSDKTSASVGIVSDALFDSTIVKAKDTVGVKLLRIMGWREGQGVGPRSRRNNDPDGDIHASNHLFAPTETAVQKEIVKRDVHGLGYDPHKEAPELRNFGKESVHEKEQKKMAGFGVGVFEDEDEDIYAHDESHRYTNIIMDEEEEIQSHNKKHEPRHHQSNTSNTSNTSKSDSKDKSQIGFDGRPCLHGFIFSIDVSFKPEWFNAPLPPKDWKHKPPFELIPLQVNKGNRNLTVDQRRRIIGEEALKGPDKSAMTTSALPLNPNAIPSVDKSQAEGALLGFMPFGNDVEKQQRYKEFLQYKAEQIQTLPKPPIRLTEQDRFHELVEFSKAAQIYRPMTTFMASRFVSASDSKTPSKEKEPLSSEMAASMKIYGQLTRQVQDWIPSRLLCKRMNIRNPYPDKTGSNELDLDELDDKEILNKETMKRLILDMNPQSRPMNEDGGYDVIDDLLEMQLIHRDEGQDDIKEPVLVRPSLDVFKSIFQDSDNENENFDDELPVFVSNENENENENGLDESGFVNEQENEYVLPLPPNFDHSKEVIVDEPQIETKNENENENIPSTHIPLIDYKEIQVDKNSTEEIQVEKQDESLFVDEKQPLPPPTFRPLFTKKQDRIVKRKSTTSNLNNPEKNKSRLSSNALSFLDDETEELIADKKDKKIRPTASDYL